MQPLSNEGALIPLRIFDIEEALIPLCIRLVAGTTTLIYERNKILNTLALVDTNFQKKLAFSEKKTEDNLPPRWVTVRAANSWPLIVPRIVPPPHVSCLQLSGIFSKDQFRSIVLRYPHVKQLRCYRVVTDADLAILAAWCHDITHLDLSGCPNVTDVGLASVAAGCSMLIDLNLSDCSRITGAGMVILAAHCHELTHLNLCGCRGIGNGIESLSTGCKKITTLNITYCDQIDDTVLERMVIGLELLHHLIGSNIDLHESYRTVYAVLLGRYRLFSDSN